MLTLASLHAALVDDFLVPTVALIVAILAVAAMRSERPARTTLVDATLFVATAFLVPIAVTQGWTTTKALDTQRRTQHFTVTQARLGCVRGDGIEPGLIDLAEREIPASARYSITVGGVAVRLPVKLCLAQVLLPRRPVARAGQAPWLVFDRVSSATQRRQIRGGRLVRLAGHPDVAVGRLGQRAR
jgi:hypothetical protein